MPPVSMVMSMKALKQQKENKMNTTLLEKQIKDAEFSVEWHAQQLKEYEALLVALKIAQEAVKKNDKKS